MVAAHHDRLAWHPAYRGGGGEDCHRADVLDWNMKTKRRLIIFAQVSLAWLVLFALMSGLSYVMVKATEASGGLVRPSPACNDAPKAGTVTLSPNGTPNAQEAVILTVPFCADVEHISVTTGVQSHNTAGERTGHNVLSPGLIAISIQLDDESSDDYDVDWQAMVKTQ